MLNGLLSSRYKNVFGNVIASLRLFFKAYQNNIFFIFKKLFLILVHQNDQKIPKTY